MSTRRQSVAVFQQFVAAINSRDVEALTSFMTPDHVFIDPLGNELRGAIPMEAGWRGYFVMCPDYWIRTDHVLGADDVVLAVGEAGGTIDGVAWRTPAAWKALIRDVKIAEWQVFADNKPVYEILASRKR